MIFLGGNKKKNVLRLKMVSFLVPVLLLFGKVKTAHAVVPLVGYGLWAAGGAVAAYFGSEAAGNIVVYAFKWLLYGIFTMFGWLASLAISIFEWAIDPNDVILLFNNPGVYESWKFVRDFFNLFFILILLYIAFTVVFQINKDFKKTILSLVLAALYINFSFPVSRALIDMTNVPMYFFANQMMARSAAQGTGILGGVMTASHIAGILIPGAEKGGDFETSEVSVSRLLMAIVFMFIFSITLLVLSIMFVIRLVALVILVIFSSVGFAASIIPGMSSYSKQWWDNFWKYALFGPAAMLMILVATRFFASMGNDSGALMQSMKAVTVNNVVASEQTFFASMALFTIPIIMLWFAMGLAQKMSIAGASTVVGLGQKVAKWVGKQATLTPAAFLGRKYEKFMTTRKGKVGAVTKWLAPTAAYKGWEKWRERSHELDHKPVEQAGAKISDEMAVAYSTTLGRLPIIGSKDHTDHAFKNFSANAAKERKEISDISTNSDYVIHELINAIKAEDDDKVVGALQILASNNDLNDMMHVMERIQDETGVNLGKVTEENPTGRASSEMSSENAKEVLKNMMKHAGLNDEMAAKNMLNISNTAIAAGNVGMAGSAKLGDDGKFRITTDEEQAQIAAAKLQNLETQARQRTLHHNAIFKEKGKFNKVKDASGNLVDEEVEMMGEDGKPKKVRVAHYGGINDLAGEAVLGTITAADLRESHRSRDDLKREIAIRMEVIREGSGGKDLEGNIVPPEEVEKLKKEMEDAMEKNPNLKHYFKLLYAYQTGVHYDSQSPADKDGKEIKPKEGQEAKAAPAAAPAETPAEKHARDKAEAKAKADARNNRGR
ncbi:MAG: hypothetical protein Q7S04_04500 [Candidatus Moranbacteria bacterium]|nr:hypothetical protein [Candidatus Moranbacteria bacterium]